jgi:hypothetical protein
MKRGPEAALQVGVCEFAALNGWRYFHPPDNRPVQGRGGRTYVQNVKAGYPDLTLVHEVMPWIVWAELKAAGGTTTEAQRAWLADLARVAEAIATVRGKLGENFHGERPRVEVKLWTPADWPDIERTLEWVRP